MHTGCYSPSYSWIKSGKIFSCEFMNMFAAKIVVNIQERWTRWHKLGQQGIHYVAIQLDLHRTRYPHVTS